MEVHPIWYVKSWWWSRRPSPHHQDFSGYNVCDHSTDWKWAAQACIESIVFYWMELVLTQLQITLDKLGNPSLYSINSLLNGTGFDTISISLLKAKEVAQEAELTRSYLCDLPRSKSSFLKTSNLFITRCFFEKRKNQPFVHFVKLSPAQA